MKYNEVVTAVLELAGFRGLEDHEGAFLEKGGEFIASAIANVQNNESKTMIEQMHSRPNKCVHRKKSAGRISKNWRPRRKICEERD